MTPPRTVRVLHVEDHLFQQRLAAALFRKITEFTFQIVNVVSEQDAVTAFQGGGFECVLLDYQLAQGNGLDCLKKLRALDPVTPVIALSGAATTEIAGQLLHAGADDFLNKSDLTAHGFSQCVRNALARADAWRRRAAKQDPRRLDRPSVLMQQLCLMFGERLGRDYLSRMDEIESAVRAADLNSDEVRKLYERVFTEFTPSEAAPGPTNFNKRACMPVFVDLLLRLANGPQTPEANAGTAAVRPSNAAGRAAAVEAASGRK